MPRQFSPGSDPGATGIWLIGLLVGLSLFTALLYYFAFLLRDASTGGLGLGQARPAAVVGAMALLLASYALQAIAWHALVRAAGEPQPLSVDASRWCLSLVGKYFPGKVFNALGRLYLYRRSAPGATGMAAAFVTESLLSLAAAACAAMMATWFVRDAAPTPALGVSVAGAAVGMVMAFSTLLEVAASWVARRILHTAPPPPIALRDRVLPFVLQFASYLLMGSGLYVLTLAWPAFEPIPAAAVIGGLCLSGTAGIVAFVVPAGIGVREGALLWVLLPFTTPSFAAPIAISSRVWLTAGDVIAVTVGALLVRFGTRD